MLYEKPVLTLDEQINKLKSRGLTFENEEIAKKYLSHISYYRLVGYWWPL